MPGTEKNEVLLYVTSFCGYCVAAKKLLKKKGVPYREINLDGDGVGRKELIEASGGARTVPQIFVGDVHVGGFDELNRMERRGQLDPLLEDKGIAVA